MYSCRSRQRASNQSNSSSSMVTSSSLKRSGTLADVLRMAAQTEANCSGMGGLHLIDGLDSPLFGKVRSSLATVEAKKTARGAPSNRLRILLQLAANCCLSASSRKRSKLIEVSKPCEAILDSLRS